MALPVYQSIQSTEGSGTSVVVTKPTSLATGDLMIGLGALTDNSAGVPSLPSGWTASLSHTNAGSTGMKLVVGYKIATAGDVAASNFTFTATASPEQYSCHILRFTTSSSFVNPVIATAAADDANDSTNPTFTVNFDAIATDAMLIALYARRSQTTSVSNYTLSGTNPTWTERYDNSDADISVAIATAPTTVQTSFTTFELDTALTGPTQSAILMSIGAVSNASADVGHLAVTPTLFGLAGSNTATASVGHLEITPTVNGLSTKQTDFIWTNPDKSSATWINPDK